MPPPRPVALVTGASAGIGKELARVFARNGHDLILTARREAELRALADELARSHGAAVHIFPADLSDPAAPRALYDKVAAAGLNVDVLVNNAGFGVYGPFADADPVRVAAMVQVNVAALTDLTRLFLPGMVARGTGRILNVASTAAFQPGPLMAVYYATKAYVLSLSEATAYELRRTGVTVTCLCPGPTRTEFATVAAMEDTKLFDAPYAMEVGPVAEAAYRATMRGTRVVVPGVQNWVGASLARFIPHWLLLRIVYRIQKRRTG
ncbi:SDR family NAD(P)-dependent oxidoreductase [Fimbriiglobus ruber]|uniref:3-oxoacyl-[acyl-carrier protein] reductase n=1 Tax=Fimbriiglobus ruber TaxID=1908690 RepID=A0A225DFJ2_9BACT|nr:SDR family oxidoreductase [Fimbriiglobus ruber]OWK40252.1 3-oxoacyl-[acyl-carrier protein] reductase [Fimbriiglobus ruber]